MSVKTADDVVKEMLAQLKIQRDNKIPLKEQRVVITKDDAESLRCKLDGEKHFCAKGNVWDAPGPGVAINVVDDKQETIVVNNGVENAEG